MWVPGVEFTGGPDRITYRNGSTFDCLRCHATFAYIKLLYASNGVPTPVVVCADCGNRSGFIKLAEVPNWRMIELFRDNRIEHPSGRCHLCGFNEAERCNEYNVWLCRDCHYISHTEYRYVRDKISARRQREESTYHD